MSKKIKRIRSFGWLFLGIYLFLLGLNTFHFHHYDFNTYTFLNESPSRSVQVNDIIQDFSGSCIVQHFVNTLLNNSYPSIEISAIVPPLTEYFHTDNFFISSNIQYSSLAFRAPPAFI